MNVKSRLLKLTRGRTSICANANPKFLFGAHTVSSDKKANVELAREFLAFFTVSTQRFHTTMVVGLRDEL